MDPKFVCPCGLTCWDCLFYKPEIYKTAIKLKDLIKSSQFDVFLGLIVKNESWNAMAEHIGADRKNLSRYFKSFKKLPDFLTVLDGIINLQCKETCQEAGGCSIGGVTHACAALKCVKSKGYNGCWDCTEVETCENLNFLKRSYGETIEGNLELIIEKGINAVQSRGNKYYGWQKK